MGHTGDPARRDLRAAGTGLVALTYSPWAGIITLGVNTRKRAIAIDVSWADRRLAKDCATDIAGIRRFGPDQWKVVRRRVAVLQAAPSLAAVHGTPGRLHGLTGDRAGQYALDLRGPTRLVFEPNHDPVPMLPWGGLDEARVTAIRILGVTDYHD